MKKLVSIFLVAMLLIVSISALADDFTLHSNVQFGMTKEETIATETKAGFTLEEGSAPSSDTKRVVSILEADGEFAKCFSHLEYMFDKDEKVIAARYYSGGKPSRVPSEDFDTINALLQNKYGSPDETVYLAAVKCGIEPLIQSLRFLTADPFSFSPALCSAWSIDQGNGTFVVIVHYFYQFSMFGDAMNQHEIAYQIFTNEELETGAGEVIDEYNKTNDDL